MSLTAEDWKSFDRRIGIGEQKDLYLGSNKAPDKWIFVKTGDRKGAGTDASVYIILHDANDKKSDDILMDHYFHDDMERGQTDVYQSPALLGMGSVVKIEIWRSDNIIGSDWFCDVIVIHDVKKNVSRYFPVHRWIKTGKRYIFFENDTFLPQHDRNPEQREEEIAENREAYRFEQKVNGLPVQVSKIPSDEEFASGYRFNIAKRKAELLTAGFWAKISESAWNTIGDVARLYAKFETPKSYTDNSFKDDLYFGAQRLVACNPTVIKLCTELPKCMDLTDNDLKRFLEDLTIQEAIDEKRLFLVDHKILKDVETKNNNPLATPMALFFWNKDEKLVPVAIQLDQFKPNDPIFFPDDPVNTWTLAKMWFNHADAVVHQSNTHLALTHMLMEGICCSLHRNLGPGHPIFRFLSPHFLYLIAIDTHGLKTLISIGGWGDVALSVGVKGMFSVMARGTEAWRMNVEGTLPNLLRENGTLDPDILPHYGYRNDALLFYDAIKNYTTKIVSHYYAEPKLLADDYEIQDWAKELVLPIDQGGVGIKGVAGNGKFTNNEDLIEVLTSIVFTCSVQHAAVNFPQYDEYGYPANYPGAIHGQMPTDKRERTEQDLLDAHPTFKETLDMMTVTKILSEKGTKSLGDWELQYQYDPPALVAEKEFRQELTGIAEIIDERNKKRQKPYIYEYLHPDFVPNAISI